MVRKMWPFEVFLTSRFWRVFGMFLVRFFWIPYKNAKGDFSSLSCLFLFRFFMYLIAEVLCHGKNVDVVRPCTKYLILKERRIVMSVSHTDELWSKKYFATINLFFFANFFMNCNYYSIYSNFI